MYLVNGCYKEGFYRKEMIWLDKEFVQCPQSGWYFKEICVQIGWYGVKFRVNLFCIKILTNYTFTSIVSELDECWSDNTYNQLIERKKISIDTHVNITRNLGVYL